MVEYIAAQRVQMATARGCAEPIRTEAYVDGQVAYCVHIANLSVMLESITHFTLHLLEVLFLESPLPCEPLYDYCYHD